MVQVNDALVQFGERVRQLRIKAKLSQAEFGEVTGMHRNYVSQLERGRRNVSLLNILAIARALKVPASKLIENIR